MSENTGWPELIGTRHGTAPCTGDHAAGNCSGWTGEPAYVREEKRMAHLRALVAEPYTLGTITVSLDGDAWNWDFNAPYIKGVCSECGATVVQAGRGRASMRDLALAIAYTWCKQRNHVQDYAALLKIDAPQYPEEDD